MSENQKYIIIKLSEAKEIKNLLKRFATYGGLEGCEEMLERVENETGADIEDIAQQLKRLDVCFPCKMEGQERCCESLKANKLGRRLYRLISRANYTRS